MPKEPRRDLLQLHIGRSAEIYCDIMMEVIHAENKFPTWPTDHVHGAAIVAEEAGEIVKAALQNSYEHKPLNNIRDEAIQTAAMCFRLIAALSWDKVE